MTTRSITPVRRAAVCLVLTGAGLGVASGGGAWAATAVPCGTPAHPALYSTTHHEAVPAVTHLVKVVDTAFVPGRAATDEVSHLEFTTVDGEGTPEGEGWRASGTSWTIVDTPAYTNYGWLRTIIDRAGVAAVPAKPAVTHEETVVDQAAWDETVIDQPAKPAVEEVSHFETVVDKAAWDETVIDQPAKPAVEEVSHFETVVDKAAWDETVIDQPAKPAVEEVSHFETVVDKAAWDETVIDQPAKPAVEEVSHFETVVDKAAWDETVVDGYAYRQKQTGNIRWEDSPTWNVEGGQGNLGWVRVPDKDKTHVVHHEAVTHQVKVIDTPASPATPEVSHVVHHPAVTHQVKVIDTPASPATPEVSHVVHHPAVTHQVKVIDTPASPATPEVSHVVHHPAVTHQVKVIDTPASPATPEVSHVVHHPAVTHTETVVDSPEVPAVEAVEELSHVETAWTRGTDTPPEGQGWYLSGEKEYVEATTHVRHEWMRTVVDVPAAEAVPEVAEVSHLETVVDEAEVAAWDEQVLESEATPAGPACPTAVLGETAPVAGAAHVAAATAPTAVSAETLAQTGTDLAVPFGAGLAFVFVGGALVAAGRGRRD